MTNQYTFMPYQHVLYSNIEHLINTNAIDIMYNMFRYLQGISSETMLGIKRLKGNNER